MRKVAPREARFAEIRPLPQEDSRESGHKAIKKALGANAKSAPKGLFYGLAARLAGTLPTKPPHQED